VVGKVKPATSASPGPVTSRKASAAARLAEEPELVSATCGAPKVSDSARARAFKLRREGPSSCSRKAPKPSVAVRPVQG